MREPVSIRLSKEELDALTAARGILAESTYCHQAGVWFAGWVTEFAKTHGDATLTQALALLLTAARPQRDRWHRQLGKRFVVKFTSDEMQTITNLVKRVVTALKAQDDEGIQQQGNQVKDEATFVYLATLVYIAYDKINRGKQPSLEELSLMLEQMGQPSP